MRGKPGVVQGDGQGGEVMAFDRPSANGWLMAGETLCSNTGQAAGF